MSDNEKKSRLISYDDVLKAVESLKAAGRQPSLRVVRDAIGRGSIATIQPILKQVIESFKTVSPETEAKMRPLMSAAAELVRNSVFEATETLRQEVARLQSDQDELIHSLNGCENRIAEADSTIAALRNEITVLNAKQEATEKTLTESKMEVIAERKDKEEFRQKLEFLKFREQDWIESKAELAKIKEQMVLEVSEAKEKAAWYKGRLDELVKDPKKDDPQSVPPTTSTTSKP